jgi:hypothetical protein
MVAASLSCVQFPDLNNAFDKATGSPNYTVSGDFI